MASGRLVVELATGARTGSVYRKRQGHLLPSQKSGIETDGALAERMPSELWPHATQKDCAGVVTVDVHAVKSHVSEQGAPWPDYLGTQGEPWVRGACGGRLTRAVFLVRHPFATIWSSMLVRQRNTTGRCPPTSVSRDMALGLHQWHLDAVAASKQWVSMVNFNGKHVDWSWRLWRRSQRDAVVFRFEDLQAPERQDFEFRRLFDYLLHGQPTALRLNPKVPCAVKAATQMHDAHCRGALLLNRAHMRGAFENEHYRTGDQVWKELSFLAEGFGYSRHSY